MSRILAKSGPYGRHHRLLLRRFEMRDALVTNAGHALPGIEVVKAELIKRYENEEFEVDLALFDFVGMRWWVALVLAQVDDFDIDVLIPTHALRRTGFLTEDAEALASRAPNGRDADVRSLVLNQVPELVVFVSRPEPGWFDRIMGSEGHLAVLETFSNLGGDSLLRINGDLPHATGTRITECTQIPGAPRLLKLPGQAPAWPQEPAVIEYEGETLRATTTIAGNDVLLSLDSHIESGKGYSLWRLADRYFELRWEEA
ncbi:MAG: hypothetical protein WD049_02640 [Candidatus Paceibacterota bacterium]